MPYKPYRPNVPLLEITTANGCAWRAIYIAVRRHFECGTQYRAQIAHIGIDPNISGRAEIFGGLAWGRRGVSFRLRVPFSTYRCGDGLRAALHQRVRTWLHSIDGRFCP